MNGTTPTLAGLTLIICYFAQKWRLRAQLSCKKEGKARNVSHAFLGALASSPLGWLVFKIAERMGGNRGGTDLLQG